VLLWVHYKRLRYDGKDENRSLRLSVGSAMELRCLRYAPQEAKYDLAQYRITYQGKKKTPPLEATFQGCRPGIFFLLKQLSRKLPLLDGHLSESSARTVVQCDCARDRFFIPSPSSPPHLVLWGKLASECALTKQKQNKKNEEHKFNLPKALFAR